MSDWIDWQGGECPVAADALVEVRFRDGNTFNHLTAGKWTWEHPYRAHDDDIVAYRVLPPAPTIADLAARDAEIERLDAGWKEAFDAAKHWQKDAAEQAALLSCANAELDRLRAELGTVSEKLMIAGTDNARLRAELAQARELIVEAGHWLHALLDRPPQTPDAVAVLSKIDAAIKGGA